MATAIIRPTGHIDYSDTNYGIVNMKYLYDNDTSTHTEARRTTSGVGVLINFDTSSIPAEVKNGGKITKISFCILNRTSSNPSFKIRAVYGATSTSDYTDCGDGSLALPIKSSLSYSAFVENLVDLPQATIYWQNNLEAFFNGGFQIRLYGANTEAEMTEAYAYVEYEMPTITVTTEASPAEGGTVTGGGTYESGSTVTVTAIPNSGYAFSHWEIGGVNVGTTNPALGALTEDTAITAVFEKVSKIRYGTDIAKSVFDTNKNKAKSVWYGSTQIL